MKLFVTASAKVRAHRRWLELTEAGHEVTEAEVLADVQARDTRDSDRADAPLRAAPDALDLDTTTLGIDEALDAAAAHVREKLEG